MPEPDWEPRAHDAAKALYAKIQAEIAGRALIPLIDDETAYLIQAALAQAVLTGISAGQSARDLVIGLPPAVDLQRCQVCRGVPVVVRWYTDEGPVDLCPECDRRRMRGFKPKLIK